MIFAAYFILRGRDMHIDLPSDAKTFITAKEAHWSNARRRLVRDQKTCLQFCDYLSQIACYVPTKKAM